MRSEMKKIVGASLSEQLRDLSLRFLLRDDAARRIFPEVRRITLWLAATGQEQRGDQKGAQGSGLEEVVQRQAPHPDRLLHQGDHVEHNSGRKCSKRDTEQLRAMPEDRKNCVQEADGIEYDRQAHPDGAHFNHG